MDAVLLIEIVVGAFVIYWYGRCLATDKWNFPWEAPTI